MSMYNIKTFRRVVGNVSANINVISIIIVIDIIHYCTYIIKYLNCIAAANSQTTKIIDFL